MLKILVPTAGSHPASETADYAIQVGSSLGAKVIALHVLRPGMSKEASELTLEYFAKAGEEHGVKVECLLREGPVVDEIISYAEEHEVDLIVMGASGGHVVDMWITSDVRVNTMIPVLVLPYQMLD